MSHQGHASIGLARLGDSDFVLEDPEQDIRGNEVYDPKRQRIGNVDDLYIDLEEREVRFLEVVDGGLLGILGIREKRFLVPVESVTEVVRGLVTVEPGRTEKVDGPAAFDTKVVPPPVGGRPEGYDPPPFGNAEGTADRSSFPYGGRRPY
jgi:sporulation protein YlmC with PRC-barrel domain